MMNGPESRGDSGPFSVANKTRLALLPDLAVLTCTVYGRAPGQDRGTGFCQWVLL